MQRGQTCSRKKNLIQTVLLNGNRFQVVEICTCGGQGYIMLQFNISRHGCRIVPAFLSQT